MQPRLCALLLLALPQAALAVDFDASVQVDTNYDSNVFNENKNDGDREHAKQDVGTSLQPNLRLTQLFSRGSTSLNYFNNLQRWYLNRDIRARQIDDNHFGTWNLEYALGRRTNLELSDTVESTLNHDFSFDRTDSGGSLDEEVQGRNTINVASAGIEHAFSRQLSGNLGGGHQLFRSQDEDQVDSQAFNVEAGLRYRFGADHTFGLTSSVSSQFYERFEDPDGAGTAAPGDDVIVPSSRSMFVSGQATWSWQVFPETMIGVGAGPAWVYTRREEFSFCSRGGVDANDVILGVCPANNSQIFVFRPATSTDRITVFASASLTQQLGDHFRARIAYNRSEAAAQGTSGSSVRDGINASLSWQLSERAEVALLGTWNQRNSATNLDTRTNRGQIDNARWTLGTRGSYQLTRHLSLRGQVVYGHQKDGRDRTFAIPSRELEQVRASLGLVYSFKRVSFFD